jgi:hypothetical protein
MEQRPAYFNTLDVALIGAGYDPEDIDEVLWDSKAPKILRVKLKPHSQLIFLEITSHSLVVEHRSNLTHEAPTELHRPTVPSQATHALIPEKTERS